jgi:hypothetical protein
MPNNLLGIVVEDGPEPVLKDYVCQQLHALPILKFDENRAANQTQLSAKEIDEKMRAGRKSGLMGIRPAKDISAPVGDSKKLYAANDQFRLDYAKVNQAIQQIQSAPTKREIVSAIEALKTGLDSYRALTSIDMLNALITELSGGIAVANDNGGTGRYQAEAVFKQYEQFVHKIWVSLDTTKLTDIKNKGAINLNGNLIRVDGTTDAKILLRCLQQQVFGIAAEFIVRILGADDFFTIWLPQYPTVTVDRSMPIDINGNAKQLHLRQTVNLGGKIGAVQFHIGLKFEDSNSNQPCICDFAIYHHSLSGASIFPAPECFKPLLEWHRQAFFKPRVDVGLADMADKDLAEFFTQMHQSLLQVIPVQKTIEDWSRSPDIFVNGRKWNAALLKKQNIRAGVGVDLQHASEQFRTQILPFLSPLGLSPERAAYLAGVAAPDVILKILGINFVSYINKKYLGALNDSNKLEKQAKINSQKVSIQFQGGQQRVILIINCAVEFPTGNDKKIGFFSKNIVKEVVDMKLAIKIGLSWLRPELITPVIDEFDIDGNIQRANLPGTAMTLKQFMQQILPKQVDCAQFLAYCRNNYLARKDINLFYINQHNYDTYKSHLGIPSESIASTDYLNPYYFDAHKKFWFDKLVNLFKDICGTHPNVNQQVQIEILDLLRNWCNSLLLRSTQGYMGFKAYDVDETRALYKSLARGRKIFRDDNQRNEIYNYLDNLINVTENMNLNNVVLGRNFHDLEDYKTFAIGQLCKICEEI